MTSNAALLTSTEVAHRVSGNVRALLAQRGENLDWFADQIDISVFTVLKAFAGPTPFWFVLDAATALNVTPDSLLGEVV